MEQSLVSPKPGHYDVGFHQDPLMASWLILANLTLLVSAVKWHKYSFYLHAFLGLTIIGLTLAGTLHVLFQVGISYGPTKRFQTIHNIGGLMVVIWLSIQLITGIISRTIQYSGKTSPNFCKWTKRIHQYSSYMIMILGKFQYMIINYRRNKFLDIFGYLAIDAVFIGLYLWLKFGYSTIQQSVKDGQMIKYGNQEQQIIASNFITEIWLGIKSKIKQIKFDYETKCLEIPQTKYLAVVYQSQKQIPISSYVLFNDYVYDLSNLNQVHPGGQSIIQSVKNREVDRFLYGFYPLQTNQNLVIHSHTKDSLRICGQPLARIQRFSPIEGFSTEMMKVKSSLCSQIHKKSPLFMIHLRPSVLESQNWTKFTFKGYTKQSQMGQYFSLTIADNNGKSRLTRLYTSIWSMRPQNLQFMKGNFPALFGQINIQIDQTDFIPQTELRIHNQQVVPLMIKKYQKGRFTSRLLSEDYSNDLLLSKPMGAGLNYQQLQDEGQVIIICGGTGLLPFCDLIDLLFKRVKYLQKTNLSEQLKVNDPLIETDLIKNRQFIIYYACDTIQNVPSLTLAQMKNLSQSKFIRFNAFIKIKDYQIQKTKTYCCIKFQKDQFIDQIEKICQEKHRINKIFICGPQRMNYSISQVLIKNKINQKYWMFV